ncbi:hypothetical protein COV11_01465 [Candidatus Woesearchaeota archaeon CG10_big_fil_rev_8_21_14_0_10_30_7]|nr:MAG: hypothetical protein COV11_01465 [Candidatus Woesearchaeota archaeon CG10_big_fil_rev_8_21_14_0_10_30_7]
MQKKSDKKSVKLISLNINPRDLSIAIVGLRQTAYLDQTIKENFDISLHQWNKNYDNFNKQGTVDGLNLDDIVSQLDPENTDVFGFSTYIWNQEFMTNLCAKLKKKNPDAKMLFGGSQAGGYGEKFLEYCDSADFVIRGEAEKSFTQFLLSLLTGDVSDVPNLFYRAGDLIRTTIPVDAKQAKKASFLSSIADLPMPFKDEEYRKFLDESPVPVVAQFETERGCPLSCTFCSWGTNLALRRRKEEDVKEGLTFLLDHPNVRAVYIVDANPLIHPEKSLWLTTFLVDVKNKMEQKHGQAKAVFFELNPEYIKSPVVVENLAKLGGDEFAFGLQSTSDQTLQKIKRKFDRDVYETNIKLLRSYNPDANIKFSLILGLPADNYESFKSSLNFAINLRPADIYIHDLLILPGSEMYRNPEASGLLIEKHPPHRLLANKTFSRKEYVMAKHLGYHVKLLHYDKQLRNDILFFSESLCKRPVDVYYKFIMLLENSNIDTLNGELIGDVSSERFDYLTTTFMGIDKNKKLLRDLFETYKTNPTMTFSIEGTKLELSIEKECDKYYEFEQKIMNQSNNT